MNSNINSPSFMLKTGLLDFLSLPKAFFLFTLIIIAPSTILARVSLPTIFNNYMVIQQSTDAAIWGMAEPGEQVTITGTWSQTSSENTTADNNGNWKVYLETPSWSLDPYQLIVEGENNTITLTDILIGDVWICAGQSNMGWQLGASQHGREDAQASNLPNLRLYRAFRAGAATPQYDNTMKEPWTAEASWGSSTNNSLLTAFSAGSAWFGMTIQPNLGIPIGLVNIPYAGTPIEGWMPISYQADDPQVLALTKGSTSGAQYPAAIYNGMVAPLISLGIKGVIWYQGERNSHTIYEAAHYVTGVKHLVNAWRDIWAENSKSGQHIEFPFYLFQLPSWHPPQDDPIETEGSQVFWAITRESMRMASNQLNNVHAIVSIDCGDRYKLHPQDKKPMGVRAGYLALLHTYNQEIVGEGPIINSWETIGNELILTFDLGRSASMVPVRPNEPLDAFAIAGADRQFYFADVVIDGNKLILSSDDVPEPLTARYAWSSNPSERNLLYSENGFPATPFRTDTWAFFDTASWVAANEIERPGKEVKPVVPDGYEQPLRVVPEMRTMPRNSP